MSSQNFFSCYCSGRCTPTRMVGKTGICGMAAQRLGARLGLGIAQCQGTAIAGIPQVAPGSVDLLGIPFILG